MTNIPYQYGSGSSYMGAPVSNTTYGNYSYYTKPQTIGTPIGGAAGTGAAGGGASSTTTGNADAEAWFKDVMNGKNLPFGPAQQAAQLTQQTDMNAAAENARNGQLDANAAAGGASATDPSFQGAKAANFARRQTDNSKAAGQIASQAGSANFGAQANAAGQLNQNAMQRAQWAQSAAQGAGAGMPFSPWGSGQSGGGGSTQSQTLGMGLFGDNFDTNHADPYGTGKYGSGGASSLWSGGSKPKPANDGYYEWN